MLTLIMMYKGVCCLNDANALWTDSDYIFYGFYIQPMVQHMRDIGETQEHKNLAANI